MELNGQVPAYHVHSHEFHSQYHRMGKGWGCNLAGPYFPSICEALGSMPSTAEREGKGMSGGAWDLE